ncbi:MAG: MutS family DNA mismatch repair protein [Gemmatimonadota bacterium]
MLIDPHAAYTGGVSVHGAAYESASARSSRLGNVRLVTFLAAAAAFIAVDLVEGRAEAVAVALGGALGLIFLVQVAIHRRIRHLERWEGAVLSVYTEGLLRLHRDWDGLDAALPEAERAEKKPDPGHPYALDLDVTGKASLVRLLGPVTSERGRRLLRSWLHEPGAPADARDRQGAVRELAARLELRVAFTAYGRIESPDALEGISTFLAWAEADPWILGKVWMRVAAWVLPVVLLVTVLGDVLWGLPAWWLLPALAQLEVFRRVTPWARGAFSRAAMGGPPLRALVPQLELLADQTWADEELRELEARLGRGPTAAHRHLGRLSGLLDTVESRRNLVYAALAPVLLLDVHLGTALDRWRLRHGRVARDWLEAVGEWEALSALASLAHDHPDWAFPHFAPGDSAPVLSGRQLGHPLLPQDACVCNDVTVGPPGSFLLVTGSNMSGKSTLLRALGTNVVLALAGGPTCASELSLPALQVRTSMRIDDSLSEGISLFMAELLRIREIVNAAGDGGNRGTPRVLYLLDEILHGTNTAERRVAARGVLRHLLAAGAIGAVSTHDLALADAPDLTGAAHAVHFREHVQAGEHGEGTRLTFDYKLRPGIATTSNALKLLEAVGLGGLPLDP